MYCRYIVKICSFATHSQLYGHFYNHLFVFVATYSGSISLYFGQVGMSFTSKVSGQGFRFVVLLFDLYVYFDNLFSLDPNYTE